MTGYSQSMEDYLEALYVIGFDHRVVRVKDVAQFLGVTMPSVAAAMRTLSEKGLVEQEKYGHIELTTKGEKAAKEIYARHQLMYAFFSEILGLDPKVAEQDACRMEHYLSPEAQERLTKMVEFVRSCRDEKVQFLERFMSFAESGERSSCKGCPVTKKRV